MMPPIASHSLHEHDEVKHDEVRIFRSPDVPPRPKYRRVRSDPDLFGTHPRRKGKKKQVTRESRWGSMEGDRHAASRSPCPGSSSPSVDCRVVLPKRRGSLDNDTLELPFADVETNQSEDSELTTKGNEESALLNDSESSNIGAGQSGSQKEGNGSKPSMEPVTDLLKSSGAPEGCMKSPKVSGSGGKPPMKSSLRKTGPQYMTKKSPHESSLSSLSAVCLIEEGSSNNLVNLHDSLTSITSYNSTRVRLDDSYSMSPTQGGVLSETRWSAQKIASPKATWPPTICGLTPPARAPRHDDSIQNLNVCPSLLDDDDSSFHSGKNDEESSSTDNPKNEIPKTEKTVELVQSGLLGRSPVEKDKMGDHVATSEPSNSTADQKQKQEDAPETPVKRSWKAKRIMSVDSFKRENEKRKSSQAAEQATTGVAMESLSRQQSCEQSPTEQPEDAKIQKEGDAEVATNVENEQPVGDAPIQVSSVASTNLPEYDMFDSPKQKKWKVKRILTLESFQRENELPCSRMENTKQSRSEPEKGDKKSHQPQTATDERNAEFKDDMRKRENLKVKRIISVDSFRRENEVPDKSLLMDSLKEDLSTEAAKPSSMERFEQEDRDYCRTLLRSNDVAKEMNYSKPASAESAMPAWEVEESNESQGSGNATNETETVVFAEKSISIQAHSEQSSFGNENLGEESSSGVRRRRAKRRGSTGALAQKWEAWAQHPKTLASPHQSPVARPKTHYKRAGSFGTLASKFEEVKSDEKSSNDGALGMSSAETSPMRKPKSNGSTGPLALAVNQSSGVVAMQEAPENLVPDDASPEESHVPTRRQQRRGSTGALTVKWEQELLPALVTAKLQTQKEGSEFDGDSGRNHFEDPIPRRKQKRPGSTGALAHKWEQHPVSPVGKESKYVVPTTGNERIECGVVEVNEFLADAEDIIHCDEEGPFDYSARHESEEKPEGNESHEQGVSKNSLINVPRRRHKRRGSTGALVQKWEDDLLPGLITSSPKVFTTTGLLVQKIGNRLIPEPNSFQVSTSMNTCNARNMRGAQTDSEIAKNEPKISTPMGEAALDTVLSGYELESGTLALQPTAGSTPRRKAQRRGSTGALAQKWEEDLLPKVKPTSPILTSVRRQKDRGSPKKIADKNDKQTLRRPISLPGNLPFDEENAFQDPKATSRETLGEEASSSTKQQANDANSDSLSYGGTVGNETPGSSPGAKQTAGESARESAKRNSKKERTQKKQTSSPKLKSKAKLESCPTLKEHSKADTKEKKSKLGRADSKSPKPAKPKKSKLTESEKSHGHDAEKKPKRDIQSSAGSVKDEKPKERKSPRSKKGTKDKIRSGERRRAGSGAAGQHSLVAAEEEFHQNMNILLGEVSIGI